MDRRKNNGPAPNVQSAMDSDEDWENHEVGSLGVLVLGVLVRFLALPRVSDRLHACTQFSNSSVHLENCCFWEHFLAFRQIQEKNFVR